jgi:hypothetical protein
MVFAYYVIGVFFIFYQRLAPASHGCFADTKVMVYYTMHFVFI